MSNVLVVSDNLVLVNAIQRTISEQNIDASFDFRFSAINKNPQDLIALGMGSVNVKSESELLAQQFDLIISAHCKQIFPEELVTKVRCINIHPGLNPYNRGWYPQVFSIINGLPVGATVHVMDKEIDHGDIIVQQEVPVSECDTSLTVYERVQQCEVELIEKHLSQWVSGDYQSKELLGEGNYNGIKDFQNLCQLNLDQTGSLREHISLLRALSHGDFANAYFFDESGKKVFISVNLKTE